MTAREEIEYILNTHLSSHEPGSDDRSVVLENLLNRLSGLAAELDRARAARVKIEEFRYACMEANERSFIANMFCSDIAECLARALNGKEWNK